MQALGEIDGLRGPVESGGFTFDEEDWLLYAMLTDPVFMPELLWRDATNRPYAGCYRVRDYQYRLNRTDVLGRLTVGQDLPEANYAIVACARAVGKTESEKSHAQVHAFEGDMEGQNLLITAPELIHLLPLTDAIEDNLRDCRLTVEMLDTRHQQTGFTHRPFGVNFIDGTKIVGRIPKVTGPQPLDAGVLTPGGWTTMGDVQPDDMVIGSAGHPIRVLGVTGSWESELFEVGFTDGSLVKTDASHEWLVRTDAPDLYQIQSTRALGAALEGPAKHRGGTLNMWRVPPPPVVQYEEPTTPPPLDPYIVGCLIGDGSLTQHSPVLFSADEPLVAEVASRLPADCTIAKLTQQKYGWIITAKGWGHRNPVTTALRDLGMQVKAREKRIPSRLLYGTAEERLAVLQGIMDTDGTAKSQAGHLISSSAGLIDDVVQLVRSLGGWASSGTETRRGADEIAGRSFGGGVYYRATIRIRGQQIFRLQRKRAKTDVDGRQRHKSIRSVRLVGRGLVKCIKVDADDGLYLTNGLTPTHNTGVKAQHQPRLIVEEGQDYPERGWNEVNETVNYDALDEKGRPMFRYWVYGVHGGNKASGFDERARSPAYRKIQITQLMRPDWNKERKANALAAYGGSSSPDYRRNILGEPGAGANAYFVTARVMSCVDQEIERGEVKGSRYNAEIYQHQRFSAEELDALDMDVRDSLDLPEGFKAVYGGMDVGLTDSPTVISLFAEMVVKKKKRLALIRRFTLERFRPKTIRRVLYMIGWHFNTSLKSFGMDITGLGFPMFQEMEDDELCPPHLLDVSHGYMFNAKVEVGIDRKFVTEQGGVLKDQYGSMVKEVVNPLTLEKRYVVSMPFIAASTRYVREWVDTGYLLLPFDIEVTGDMLAETKQRVERIGASGQPGLAKKGDRFHVLDSFRAAAMSYKHDDIAAELALPEQTPILEEAPNFNTAAEREVMAMEATLPDELFGI